MYYIVLLCTHDISWPMWSSTTVAQRASSTKASKVKRWKETANFPWAKPRGAAPTGSFGKAVVAYSCHKAWQKPLGRSMVKRKSAWEIACKSYVSFGIFESFFEWWLQASVSYLVSFDNIFLQLPGLWTLMKHSHKTKKETRQVGQKRTAKL